VSVSTLRLFGGYLIDIHGQFDTHSLLSASKQREALNAFGGLQKRALEVSSLFHDWKQAQAALNDVQKALYDIQREELWLRDCVEELDALSPYEGQEAEIFEQRTKLASRETFVRAYGEACAALSGEGAGYDSDGSAASALASMNTAMHALEKIADKAEGDIRPLLERMDQCYQEIRDLNDTVVDQLHAIDHDAASLDELETTLHQIRRLSRKHHCADGDALVALHKELSERLDLMDHSDARIEALEKDCAAKKAQYFDEATKLLEAQKKTAKSLEKDIEAELPPLKLGNASFDVTFDIREEEQWSAEGIAKIGFSVRMNAGGHFGALDKVASGGELSRIMLALKVILTKTRVMPVMIFDEIDSGMGGQTAHALGERLKRLSKDCQLLCITHAPQVAACADMHMVVSKDNVNGQARTQLCALQTASERRAEIARMLSGADITEEAMAAAKSLMDKAA
jgi:DNA repair protein RecN (Recombination protein N)